MLMYGAHRELPCLALSNTRSRHRMVRESTPGSFASSLRASTEPSRRNKTVWRCNRRPAPRQTPCKPRNVRSTDAMPIVSSVFQCIILQVSVPTGSRLHMQGPQRPRRHAAAGAVGC